MDESLLIQLSYTAVIEHFIKTGRAPHYTELAATLGILPEEGRLAQRKAAEASLACWFVKGVQVARRSRSRCGGCSRVEHRLFGTACLVASLVPAALSGVVVERGSRGVWCLARCWVLKARAFFAGFFSADRSCWSYRYSLLALVLGVWLALACGVGSARILRTTQWTRASL